MRQLWGQRKNCAVAQPGGQAGALLLQGRAGAGGGRGAARFPGFQVFTGPGAVAGGKLKF